MKILIITDIAFPTDHSFLEEVYNKRLKDYGHEITWLMKSKFTIENNIENRKWGNNNVILLKSYGVKNIKNSIKTHIKILKYVKKTIANYNPDTIIVRNDPLMGLIAMKYCKKHNKKFIYQYSFYKSKSHKDKKGINSRVKYLIGSWLEKSLLLGADHVFPISEHMAKEIEKEIKINPNKLTSFTLGVDETQEIIDQDLTLKKSLGLGNNVLAYLGALDQSRKPEFLIDTFKLVIKEKPDSQLLLIGDTIKKEELVKLKNYVKLLNFTNKEVIFTGRIKRKLIYKYIALTDVCLSPIPPEPRYKIASPIKVMDYLINGKPVVVNNEIIEQNRIVENANCGYSVTYDTTYFAQSILKILNNKKKGKKMGEKGREYVIKNKSYKKITQDINNIIENVKNK